VSATLHPLSMALIALLVVLALTLGRRQALWPLWCLVCLMPMGQEFVVLNLHFPLFRVLLLAIAVRVLLRGEHTGLAWTRADRLVLAWACVAVPLGALGASTDPTLGNRLGDSYNTALAYFAVRCLVRDIDDVVANITQLALLALPVAGLMLEEHATGHNLLAAMGGVPELTQIRNGELRCQGAFRHPLLAGAFGATQLPLFIALFVVRPRRRVLAVAAMVAALVIVLTAASSGAVLALAAGLLALAAWRIRHRMRTVRWTVLALLLVAAAAMDAPVWYLLARLSDLVGGGGWHRAWLIQQAIDHVDEWWLFGTNFTAHWGPAGDVIDADPNMMDITNHYIMEGVRGGLLRLALFVAILAAAFGGVGRVARQDAPGSRRDRFLAWGLGASLFAHAVTFMSVNYFDQMILVLASLLAAITSVTGSIAASAAPAVLRERDGASASPPRPAWY
jgi:hypothetical protein